MRVTVHLNLIQDSMKLQREGHGHSTTTFRSFIVFGVIACVLIECMIMIVVLDEMPIMHLRSLTGLLDLPASFLRFRFDDALLFYVFLRQKLVR